jgi:hypothetical protein
MIAGERDVVLDTESARAKARSRAKLMKALRVSAVIVMFGILVVFIIVTIASSENTPNDGLVTTYDPTVEIVDENRVAELSVRTRNFIGMIERDLADLELILERVILPLGKIREIHLYIEGRVEYYKVVIDRGSAVQAEDIERMIRHLDREEIQPGYVDVRVAGRAYFK